AGRSARSHDLSVASDGHGVGATASPERSGDLAVAAERRVKGAVLVVASQSELAVARAPGNHDPAVRLDGHARAVVEPVREVREDLPVASEGRVELSAR